MERASAGGSNAMWRILRIVASLSLLVGPLSVPTGAHGGEPETAVIMTGITGTIEVTPGLCWPGAEPLGCTGTAQAQAHAVLSTCVAEGTFEGLPASGPCGMEVSAFMDPVLQGTQPSCVTSHTYVSDDATAFGPPVNRVGVAGLARIFWQYPPVGRAGGVLVATGLIDDADPDESPDGDHTFIFTLRVRPPNLPDACLTTRATQLEIQAGAGYIG